MESFGDKSYKAAGKIDADMTKAVGLDITDNCESVQGSRRKNVIASTITDRYHHGSQFLHRFSICAHKNNTKLYN